MQAYLGVSVCQLESFDERSLQTKSIGVIKNLLNNAPRGMFKREKVALSKTRRGPKLFELKYWGGHIENWDKTSSLFTVH